MTLLSTDTVLAAVRDLPALPAVVNELIASLGDDDARADRLAATISRDPTLAAKTLRLANSSFYGMSRQVVSVADAVALIGLRSVRNVALAAGLAGALAPQRCAGFDAKGFWRHSLGSALCAGALAGCTDRAEHANHDTGAAFALGLLHDIGQLALASHFAAPYAAALHHQRAHDCPPLEAERAVLGTDHAQVGAWLAAHWRFAPEVVIAIGAHHDPVTPAAAPGASLTDLLHVADNLAHALDLSGCADDLVPPLSMDAWLRLGLTEARCLPLLARVDSEHAALCAALFA